MCARPMAVIRLLVLLVLVAAGMFVGNPSQGISLESEPASAAPLASQSESGRWIVRLEAPPLAQAPATRPEFATMSLPVLANGRMDLHSAAAQQYRSQLQQQQMQAFQQMQQAFPQIQMQRSYQVLFNGIAVSLPTASDADIERLRTMPGVAEVYPDIAYKPQMFDSLPLINAPALWENPAIGGQANAGAGIKIAVLDSGIAINNPFFNPAGFSYPEGYPKGDTAHTTPKIIAARIYLRPDLVPLPGNETPEPGPEDSSHGTHVAGIAAGNANTPATFANVTENISGVAPRAYLMNYKVFYANDSPFSNAGFSIELIAAMEDAVLDGADVMNNSWGGRATEIPATNPIAQAAEAAVDAGVTVVFAAGNEGPGLSTAGSPAYSDRLISVGAISKSRIIAAGFVDVVAPEGVPEVLQSKPFGIAEFGEPVRDRLIGPLSYLPVAAVAADGLACNPLPPGSLSGQIALIERGTCVFSLKVFHAQQAGASAAIIFNSESGGEEIINMASGEAAEQVTISSVFVQRSVGIGMLNWYADHGAAARVQIDPQGRVIDATPDIITQFSSRGPSFQGSLKPDVVAPGLNILSSGFAQAEGIEAHLGFGLSGGTSMAAPHVAGAVALLQQVHPEWSPADIKSALMSTAVQDLWLDEDREEVASVLDRGAGRIDLARAVNPGLIFDRPSLSFGGLPTTAGQPTRRELTVRARNISSAAQNYSISTRATDGPGFAITAAPAQISLGPGEEASFTVAIEIPADAPPADYGGLVELSGPDVLHIPVWARTRPAEFKTKVLLIDNDGSTSLGSHDYSGYYTSALTELGIQITYLDVDALAPAEQTLPDIGELQQHEIIIWFTGDNFVPSGAPGVPIPLTTTDQDLLIAYLQNGGNLIASGQDLADASDINPDPEPRYGRSDLYSGYLGAQWVQDDVFAERPASQRVVVGTDTQPWLASIRLDLHAPGAGVAPGGQTSAGNQAAIDEVMLSDADPRTPERYVTPILQVPDAGVAGGVVGMNTRDEPTLEKPFLGLPYRSTLLTFGLEGVRSDTGMTSRTAFLQALLYWHIDRSSVTLDTSNVTTTEANQSVDFTATAQSNTPTSFVRYRWDFGDGSAFAETAEPAVTHVYAQPGSYTVRVEATDSWGHRAISLSQAAPDATSSGGAAVQPPAAEQQPVTFPETGQILQGRFLQFWQSNGGLPVFGYPLTPQNDGAPMSQMFERVRFEYHPQNNPPYDILLGHIGVEMLQAQGRDWHSFPTVQAAPAGCLYFAETGHSLCGAFKDYWQSHGLEFDGAAGSSYAESLALFGLPISEPQEEMLEDGSVRLVQWFERARFEHHPTEQPAYRVLLGRLAANLVK